jgi:hypothetical protein
MNLPDKEQAVRRQSDLVRVLVSSVGGISHSACAAQRMANERLNVAGRLGRTFMHLSTFEAATAHPLEAEEAEKFGNGCQGVCSSSREEMVPGIAACKVRISSLCSPKERKAGRTCMDTNGKHGPHNVTLRPPSLSCSRLLTSFEPFECFSPPHLLHRRLCAAHSSYCTLHIGDLFGVGRRICGTVDRLH